MATGIQLTPAGVPAADDRTVASVQERLNELGYNAGRADGRMGPHTRSAIRAYQRDRGLLADGRATPQLAGHLWAYDP